MKNFRFHLWCSGKLGGFSIVCIYYKLKLLKLHHFLLLLEEEKFHFYLNLKLEHTRLHLKLEKRQQPAA